MTSAGEMTTRSSNSQPQCHSEKPYGQNIPPAYFWFWSHPQFTFLPVLLTKYIQLSTSTSPLAFANVILFFLTTRSKYQVSGKCLCRLKLTCKISFASLVLKPHAVKLSLSTLGGIKQFSQAFLDPELQHWISSVLQRHQTPVIPSPPPCRGCGQVEDQ